MLERMVLKRLVATGYQAKPVTRPEGVELWSKSDMKKNVDAVLGANFFWVGYSAYRATSPYRPKVWVRVQLVSTNDDAILYDRVMKCGAGVEKKKAVYKPPRTYHYKNFQTLIEEKADAVKALKMCTAHIADAIGKDLQ
jgi:hypothetical protein